MALIEIVDPDPTWPEQFAVVRAALTAALGEDALRIDHIGSTAVAGLPAKDVIDVQITVAALDPILLDRLEAAGYTARRDITDDLLTGCEEPAELAKLYAREAPGDRRTNIHIRAAGRRNQRYALLFRDHLRADTVVRDAYGDVKRHLAALYPDDAEGYYDIKDPVMDIIYRGAEAWAAATGWDGAGVPR
ncbi:MAG: GrpB family protein [Actinomycetota bacterium]